MKLTSTADSTLRTTWKEAVLRGLGPDGGLFIPVTYPHFTQHDWQELRSLPFSEMATRICSAFLSDEVPTSVVRDICHDAFSFPVPLVEVEENTFILELFHGPTCAFKDFGARFMARLFRYFLGNVAQPLTVVVATSGDTGSAVANAFLDTAPNPSIRVIVLFPKGKVSPIQELQMTTLGHNITALEVDGTFDDCQRMAKAALADNELLRSYPCTSANSINIARLLPQSLYYIHASLALAAKGPPVFSVPSGNLGNLTGGLIARAIGMPVEHFVAGTNANDVFPRYLSSGTFTPCASVETVSNAMDVGNPSNFARVEAMFDGSLPAIRSTVTGYAFDNSQIAHGITSLYRSSNYTVCPHTAVAYLALKAYQQANPTRAPGVVLATAHPAKFEEVVVKCVPEPVPLPPALSRTLHSTPVKRSISADYGDLRTAISTVDRS